MAYQAAHRQWPHGRHPQRCEGWHAEKDWREDQRAEQLKPIAEQVIVITGASSGIGLATGKMAARGGACVVLSARNERDLARAVAEICGERGRAASSAIPPLTILDMILLSLESTATPGSTRCRL